MITIALQPTGRVETVHGFHFRVYTGRTDSGIDLEMLGLFRVADPEKRAELQRSICAVKPDDPPPVRLLGEHGLIGP